MSRTYPIPAKIRSSIEPSGPLTASAVATGSMDRDSIERAAFLAAGTPLGDWASRVIQRESQATLDRLLGEDRVLPTGVLSDDHDNDDVVIGLVAGGKTWTGTKWLPWVTPGEQIELDEATVAFVADALADGASGVVLRSWVPAAIIGASDVAPAPTSPTPETATTDPTDLPEGSVIVAVVDELDKTAVLELLAVSPGPTVSRRHAGEWHDDPGWVTRLRSVKPPPLVELDPGMVASVAQQVDESTKEDPFEPSEGVTSSAASSEWSAEHIRTAELLALELALVAAKGGARSLANKAGGAERLRQYWMHGEGALKIRWGAPGDWRRCVRHLSKHLGPRAKGYCSLLHARRTGAWTGDKKHRKARGGIYADPKTRAEATAKQYSR